MRFGVESKWCDSTVLRFKGSHDSAGVALLATDDEGMARGLLCCKKEMSINTFTRRGQPWRVPLTHADDKEN